MTVESVRGSNKTHLMSPLTEKQTRSTRPALPVLIRETCNSQSVEDSRLCKLDAERELRQRHRERLLQLFDDARRVSRLALAIIARPRRVLAASVAVTHPASAPRRGGAPARSQMPASVFRPYPPPNTPAQLRQALSSTSYDPGGRPNWTPWHNVTAWPMPDDGLVVLCTMPKAGSTAVKTMGAHALTIYQTAAALARAERPCVLAANR